MSSSSASASEVSGSWEGGGFAPFSALECPHPSSQFQLVTSPTREGSHAARFNITGADVWPNTGTVRCLAAKYDTGETTGMDSYFHVSMYIPSPGISSNLIWELHHPSELYNLSKCGVAPFAITTDGKGLEFRIATGDCKVGQGWSNWESGIKIPGLNPYPTDTWIDVVVHIRFSEASDGLVEVWGRSANNPWPASPQVTRSGIPTMPYASSQGVHNVKLYTEMGLYPGYSGYNGNDTIYLDDYRRESSLASAEGSSGSGGTPAAAAAAPAAAPAPAPASGSGTGSAGCERACTEDRSGLRQGSVYAGDRRHPGDEGLRDRVGQPSLLDRRRLPVVSARARSRLVVVHRQAPGRRHSDGSALHQVGRKADL